MGARCTPAHAPAAAPARCLGVSSGCQCPRCAPRVLCSRPAAPSPPCRPAGGCGAAQGLILGHPLCPLLGSKFLFLRFSGPSACRLLFPHIKTSKTKQNKSINLHGCGKRVRLKRSLEFSSQRGAHSLLLFLGSVAMQDGGREPRVLQCDARQLYRNKTGGWGGRIKLVIISAGAFQRRCWPFAAYRSRWTVTVHFHAGRSRCFPGWRE